MLGGLDYEPGNVNLAGGQQISKDVLNKIVASGMPPHKLTVKQRALLRNMHGMRGQADGTRLVVHRVHPHILDAETVTGCSVVKIVYQSRINATKSGSSLRVQVCTQAIFPGRLKWHLL